MAEKEYQELTAQIDGLRKLIIAGSKEVLTIDECALLTGFSKAHIYRMTSQRTVPFYKPFGGTIFFRKTEIENWLLQNRQSTNEELNSRATTHCVINKR